MNRILLWSTLALLAAAVAGCGGGGVKQRVFPPSAAVKELRAANGEWELSLRIQNYGNVGMRVDSVEAAFSLGGHDAGPVVLAPQLVVPAGSAEVVQLRLPAAGAAATAVEEALRGGRPVRYRLEGTITSSEPERRRDRFEHESSLAPVPGLDRVLR
ncbi:MAG TPA: LEA type 2 family protein [Xanthomonadaceae bacterium]|nr:LEA type 2 family protein [Xanthomonadaceae bacterium]